MQNIYYIYIYMEYAIEFFSLPNDQLGSLSPSSDLRFLPPGQPPFMH